MAVMREEVGRRRINDDVARARATLRGLIIDCALEPGSRVTQAELSRLTGAGRTPLREALRMLQQEGLVKAELNKRITIASFDLDELDCAYAYRVSIEAAAIRVTAPLLTDGELAELERALGHMREAIDRVDRDAFELPHRRFHQLLVAHVQQCARTRIALDADRAERARRFLMQGDHHALSRADAEHHAIFDACRAHDGIQASRLLAKHLAGSAFHVAAKLEPTYDTVLTRMALRAVLGDDDA
jgi:DNA-binding GntR family transcriptional regulator